MGSNWQSIDNHFPTFTGNESLKDQVRLLHDFLPVLIESLKYQLNNLDASNWNAKAKETFQSETTRELEDAMDSTDTELAYVIRELEDVSGKLSRVMSRLTDAETDIVLMEQWKHEIQQQTDDLQSDMEECAAELDQIGQILTPNEDGSFTLGGEGKVLHLVGEIYLNGTLLT